MYLVSRVKTVFVDPNTFKTRRSFSNRQLGSHGKLLGSAGPVVDTVENFVKDAISVSPSGHLLPLSTFRCIQQRFLTKLRWVPKRVRTTQDMHRHIYIYIYIHIYMCIWIEIACAAVMNWLVCSSTNDTRLVAHLELIMERSCVDVRCSEALHFTVVKTKIARHDFIFGD